MLKAIPTKYKGNIFRSKLEAQWAKIFDFVGIEWVYEPEGYSFGDGTYYLPDFYLTQLDCFFEVKGIMSDKDFRKIENLATCSGKNVLIGNSNFNISCYFGAYIDEYGNYGYSEDIFIPHCRKCGCLSILDVSGFYVCNNPTCCEGGDGFWDRIVMYSSESKYNRRAWFEDKDGKSVSDETFNKIIQIDYKNKEVNYLASFSTSSSNLTMRY